MTSPSNPVSRAYQASHSADDLLAEFCALGILGYLTFGGGGGGSSSVDITDRVARILGHVIVDSLPEVEVKNDSGNPLAVSGNVGVTGNVAVNNFPSSVEVSNDVGNPLPVTGTVNLGTVPEIEIKNDSGNPLNVQGTLTVGSITNEVEVKNDSGNPLYTQPRGQVPSAQNTATSLGANATFTGSAWTDCLDFGIIFVGVVASHASATSGLYLEWSDDAATVRGTSDAYTISANSFKIFAFNPSARYFRVKYINGVVAQTSFSINTIMKVDGLPSSHRVNEPIGDESDAQLVKAVLTGRNPSGTYYDSISGIDGRLGVTTRATLSPSNTYARADADNDLTTNAAQLVYTVPVGKTLYITSAWLCSSSVLTAATTAFRINFLASASGRIMSNTHSGLVGGTTTLINLSTTQTFAEPFQVNTGETINLTWSAALAVGTRNSSAGFVGYLQ